MVSSTFQHQRNSPVETLPAVKHPVANDIDASVTEAGVTVTFKPINSIHNFYRLANNDDIARLGPVSLARVRPAGPMEIPEITHLMRSKTWQSG